MRRANRGDNLGRGDGRCYQGRDSPLATTRVKPRKRRRAPKRKSKEIQKEMPVKVSQKAIKRIAKIRPITAVR